MKGVGGKKEKKARDFIRAVMKNGSVEKGKVENHVDGEEAKTDESKAVESKITESKTTESKTTESKTTESATKTAEQEKSEEGNGYCLCCSKMQAVWETVVSVKEGFHGWQVEGSADCADDVMT